MSLIVASKDQLNDPLYFRQVDEIDDIVESLAEQPLVTFVRVYSSDGELLVDSELGDYPPGYGSPGPKKFQSDIVIGSYESDSLQVDAGIAVAGQLLGGLSMGFSARPIDEHISALIRGRLWLALQLMAGATLLSFFAAIALTRPLTRANERLRAEAVSLEEARAALAEGNEQRRRFLSVLSHELRTPLTPLLSSGELLKERLISENSTNHGRLLENMISGAYVLKARVDDLIDQASYETGQYQLVVKPVGVVAMVHEVAQLMEVEASKRGQPLELELADGLLIIEADGDRLKQALTNLLSNAITFGPDGMPIVVRAWLEGDDFFLEVRDQGPGIPPENLKHLFEPYFRREHDRVGHRGLGLGLTIVQQIVNAHGGSVEVESEPGEGTLFRLRVPVKAQAKVENQQPLDTSAR